MLAKAKRNIKNRRTESWLRVRSAGPEQQSHRRNESRKSEADQTVERKKKYFVQSNISKDTSIVQRRFAGRNAIEKLTTQR